MRTQTPSAVSSMRYIRICDAEYIACVLQKETRAREGAGVWL